MGLNPDIAQLQEKLKERDTLVAALTERLEQAAEQLDRLHRKGADRGGYAGGLPAELVKDHKHLVEELQHAVEQWEDMQAAVSLGRIEVQLSELRDLVSGHLSGVKSLRSDRHEPDDEEPETDADSAPQNGAAAWEAMKAGLLASDGETGGQAAAPPEDDLPELEPPPQIDATEATFEALQKAVIERDDFIATLLRHLRNARAQAQSSPDWESLAERAPEELCRRLKQLETSLEERLRLAEVELSLERARLGRDEMRLKHLQEQVEKQAKRAGSHGGAEGDHDDPATHADRRWLKFLGVNKPE